VRSKSGGALSREGLRDSLASASPRPAAATIASARARSKMRSSRRSSSSLGVKAESNQVAW
jgi:hypothetical protein